MKHLAPATRSAPRASWHGIRRKACPGPRAGQGHAMPGVLGCHAKACPALAAPLTRCQLRAAQLRCAARRATGQSPEKMTAAGPSFGSAVWVQPSATGSGSVDPEARTPFGCARRIRRAPFPGLELRRSCPHAALWPALRALFVKAPQTTYYVVAHFHYVKFLSVGCQHYHI